ncbi:MAG: NAD(P)-dependent oxidoreductase [Acidobacteriia bacterium]|nr:NAD(P)-dependent oxidoreductase [Terriglobia bacterium]
MKIAVIGATGNAGSRIVTELVNRGHQVTGIARHPEKMQAGAGLTLHKGDVKDEAGLAKLLAGHDAAVHSVRFLDTDARSAVGAAKKSGVKRFLVVGGAGSLEVAPGSALVDTPNFPPAYKAEASGGRDFLNTLKAERELDWTFLSPSVFFSPGERTGKFRLGKDQVLTGADGQSKISMEDYAIALVDEIEHPQHRRQRFTVGY